jgi:hypothetical protein
MSIDVHWLPPDLLAELATEAGLGEVARLVRERDEREVGPQAYILARKPE